MLKHLGTKAKELLLALYNKTWETGVIPSQWKLAIVIPVLKEDKDSCNIENYRPISLTSLVGKLMERMVLRRLNWYLEVNNVLVNEQAGFRLHRSTNQQVATLSQHIKDALDVSNILTAVFIDFKSAYDLVWKEKLILKMSKAGIKSHMLNWINAFIGQRSCKVKYGNALSKSNILQTGLPQGAVSSCSLFNIYINDLVEQLQTVTGVKCLLYADDLVLLYTTAKKNAEKRTENALNDSLKLLANWSDDNGMVINTMKTAYQTFSLAHHSISPKIMYKNTTLQQKNESTYLGVTFDTKLTWKNHTAKVSERASKRLNLLKRLAGSKWGCARSTLNTTYKMYIILL